MKFILGGAGLVIIGSLAAAGIWFALARGQGGTTRDAEDSARQYFARAVAGDYEATYSMLDSASHSAVSRDEWQRQNQAALAATGALQNAQVVASEPDGLAVSYVTVRLGFEGHDPLLVVVRMVREEGTWRVSVSNAEPPADSWEHVEP